MGGTGLLGASMLGGIATTLQLRSLLGEDAGTPTDPLDLLLGFGTLLAIATVALLVMAWLGDRVVRRTSAEVEAELRRFLRDARTERGGPS